MWKLWGSVLENMKVSMGVLVRMSICHAGNRLGIACILGGPAATAGTVTNIWQANLSWKIR